MGLKIENTRGQCYNGASTMAEVKNGIAAKIKLLTMLLCTLTATTMH